MKKNWREAATLIVIARHVSKDLKFDYKVLTFKRTEKTSFMPNNICFPGGAIDKSDESKDWIAFLKKYKVPIEELLPKPGAKRPFIYDRREGFLDREISLRITAIRETLEEVGIAFLCKPDVHTSPFSSYYHAKDFDIPLWQKKIHNQQDSLMEFCEKHNLIPDIMNIHEWSCWLTPTFFRPKRFETAFFLVALNSIPPVYPETHEVQEFFWETPDEILRLYQEQKIWLPPPQFAEIRRLSTIGSIDKLIEIAKERNGRDMQQIMPIQYKAKDGFLHVLPGDDLYHESPNYNESDHNVEEYAEKTLEEMRAMAKNLCRSEQRDFFDVKFVTNIQPADGLIGIRSDPISKL